MAIDNFAERDLITHNHYEIRGENEVMKIRYGFVGVTFVSETFLVMSMMPTQVAQASQVSTSPIPASNTSAIQNVISAPMKI